MLFLQTLQFAQQQNTSAYLGRRTVELHNITLDSIKDMLNTSAASLQKNLDRGFNNTQVRKKRRYNRVINGIRMSSFFHQFSIVNQRNATDKLIREQVNLLNKTVGDLKTGTDSQFDRVNQSLVWADIMASERTANLSQVG